MIQKAISETRDELMPLAQFGRTIRGKTLGYRALSRRFGNLKIETNSHYLGAALADASMYQSFAPQPRQNRKSYRDWYGVSPDFVWEHRGSTHLLNVLDCYGKVNRII